MAAGDELSGFLQRLTRTRLGREILTQEAAEALDRRQGAATAMAQLQGELDAAAAPLNEEIEKRSAKIATLTEQLKGEQERRDTAARKLASTRKRLGDQILARSRYLRATAPAEIGEFEQFVGWIVGVCEGTIRRIANAPTGEVSVPAKVIGTGSFSFTPGKTKVARYDGLPESWPPDFEWNSLRRRARKAEREVRGLPFIVDQAALAERIDELRAELAVPDFLIEAYRGATATHRMPEAAE